MPEKLIIVFILGAAISLVSLDVLAQTEAPAGELAEGSPEAPVAEPLEKPVDLELLFDPQEGSGELSAIKEKIQSLLRQNEELAPQVEPLKQELGDLQEKVKQSRAEIASLEKKRSERQKDLEQNMKNMRGSGQPAQALRLLQSYDMQYQEKELELELKLKELASRDKRLARERQLAGLQKELEQNTAEEKRLADEAQVFKDNAALVYELEFLKQENILLEDQLRSPGTLSGSGGIKPESGAAGETIRRKEEERERLARAIEELKVEQESVSAPEVAGFSVFEARFRDSVKVLEEENKQLKNQIFSLQEKTQKRSQ
ncbi:MAG: hypothetical protein HZC18_02535 [Candidatus Omnitrophica bacterium]|nr:hypothetical protein [Candidatus Omnitrophota bacterium]